MKNLLKIILPTAISIIGSIFLYSILHNFMTALLMEQLKMMPGAKNNFPVNSFDYSLYFFCLTYLFALITLPFILSVVAEKRSVQKGNIGIKLLIAEVLVLILVWLFSPPDMISIILQFLAWQIPIAVNFITLIVLNRKKH